MKSSRWTGALCAALAATGCSSSDRYPSEEREAERAVAHAKEAGAGSSSRPSVAGAQKAIDEARAAEVAALRDDKEARAQLDKANKRGPEVERRLATRKSERRAAEMDRLDHLVNQDAQVQRRDDLLFKGATPAELKQTVDPDLAVTKARVRRSDAMIETLTQQIALDELERAEVDRAKQFAEARMSTAQQRLKVARSLYESAQQQARLAESESLDAKRAELRESGSP